MLDTLAYCSLYSVLLGSVNLMWKEIIVNWILFVRGTNFQRQIFAYKFQVFITIGINSLSTP